MEHTLKFGPWEGKLGIKGHGDYTTENMSGRSTTNTYETAQSKSSEITDEISVTIGEHNEPAGLYRYSLFVTADVYYVLQTDTEKTEVKKAYTSWCARPTTYWALDYEPELGGSFRKTAPGALLEIPEPLLSRLPTPTENDLTPVPPQRAGIPVANNPSGTYETSVTVTLTSETEGAAIHYTMNGDTPTASSTRYSEPIVITNSCALRAIAVYGGIENSMVMTENYGIDDEPLQTQWTMTLAGSGRIIKDDLSWADLVHLPYAADVYHNYDPVKLKAAGYAYIKIQGSFTGKETTDDGWIWFDIKKGHNNSQGTVWFYYHGYDILTRNIYYEMFIPPSTRPEILVPLDDFELDFTLIWGASGDGSDDWELGRRTLTFTAIRN
jgi:hypothetical protein